MVFLLATIGEDALVHRRCLERQVVGLAQSCAQIVRVQDRHLGGGFQARPAETRQIGVGTEQDARVAVERAHPTDALRGVVTPAPGVADPPQTRDRQIGLQNAPHGDRTRPGAAPAMGRVWTFVNNSNTTVKTLVIDLSNQCQGDRKSVV